MSQDRWILSRVYPVDLKHDLIYDIPQKRGDERPPEHALPGAEWSMMNGRLLVELDLPDRYRVIHAGEVPKVCYGCEKVYPVPESLDGLEPSEYVCCKACADRTVRPSDTDSQGTTTSVREVSVTAVKTAASQQLLTEDQLNQLLQVLRTLDEITEDLNVTQPSGEDMKDLGAAWCRVREVLERYGKEEM